MRYIYNLLIYICLPFILLRLLWQSRLLPAYRQRWRERFGFVDIANPCPLWLHAVSLGEVIAAKPLVEALLQRYPNMRLLITTQTPTGSQRVREWFGARVEHVYVPYDLPDCVARFIKKIQPQLLIIMETELWPNMLHQCSRANIPVIIANARLSQRSAAGYKKVAKLTRQMLANVAYLAAQSEHDMRRYCELGMPAEKACVVGNIKFDIIISQSHKKLAATFGERFGAQPLWIAASTHSGEDEICLEAHRLVQQSLPDARLLLVPRHPERFEKVASLSKASGFKVVKRSDEVCVDSTTAVIIGDSLGEMLSYYACADCAFVAGSLLPVGGHNILEPAALQKPVITGPYVENFAAIVALFMQSNAISRVCDAKALSEVVIDLLSDPQKREAQGKLGGALVIQNQGSLERHLTIIEKHFTPT